MGWVGGWVMRLDEMEMEMVGSRGFELGGEG